MLSADMESGFSLGTLKFKPQANALKCLQQTDRQTGDGEVMPICQPPYAEDKNKSEEVAYATFLCFFFLLLFYTDQPTNHTVIPIYRLQIFFQMY